VSIRGRLAAARAASTTTRARPRRLAIPAARSVAQEFGDRLDMPGPLAEAETRISAVRLLPALEDIGGTGAPESDRRAREVTAARRSARRLEAEREACQ
jgi:hypothetical protein